MPAVRIVEATTTDHELTSRRLNIMRFGYAFMGVGLAIVKWPILVQNAPALPVFEGVVACLLTAMSLLAFLGLRYPVRMLPILLFEVIWKLIWIAAVAVPHLIADDINAATRAVLVNCSLVVIIITVIPGGTSGSATSGHPRMLGGDDQTRHDGGSRLSPPPLAFGPIATANR